ncbi:unnamed protein product [Choristocarpus tenellus]
MAPTSSADQSGQWMWSRGRDFQHGVRQVLQVAKGTAGRTGREKGRVFCFMYGKDGRMKCDYPDLDRATRLGGDDGQGRRWMGCTGLSHEVSEYLLTVRASERTGRPSGRGAKEGSHMVSTTTPPPTESPEVEDISSRLDRLEGFIRSFYFGDREHCPFATIFPCVCYSKCFNLGLSPICRVFQLTAVMLYAY